MSTEIPAENTQYGPWNPGIRSELPSRLLALSTMFRPENVFTRVEHAYELRDLTGLELEELVIFRPERLVVHELLIRVTVDLSVPDPDSAKVEDPGISFRQMTQTILTKYIRPHFGEIVGAYDSLKRMLFDLVHAELAAALDTPLTGVGAVPAKRTRTVGLLDSLRWFRPSKDARPRVEDERAREEPVLREWGVKAQSTENPLAKAAYRSLIRVVSAVRAKRRSLAASPATSTVAR
jgi:hypothetical protein